ncbi:protein serine/threonine phosphatase [Methylobacterium sp. 4-46]|uniref:SpoIIE family protein phosphatase n=1 Tax=unclassified Methylobacterium TaxID=2615210 RepID=UPI000152DCE7|nr:MULTISPECIES: SpoIIE family protein phosphatase [Methylobacterium]ACA16272.1 protein serine/threonine phosphatase [Methylobacterium sp. 4-46]WFT81982.1 SpoIIE family protein phosphatase [Methylobacterium nodulans]
MPLRRGEVPLPGSLAAAAADRDRVADIMRPGALRGAARGRNLDSLAHTLFLRIYPVIAVVVLLTQIGIALVSYLDQLRLYGERASLLAGITAAALARPGLAGAPEALAGPLRALALDPAFRSAALRDPEGRLIASAGETPRRAFDLIQASADVASPGDGRAGGTLTVALSAESLRDNAWRQALLALGTSLVLMLAFVLTLHATVRRHVLAPLARLLGAMRAVEHKRWTAVDLGDAARPSNEIDAITSAFNRMVEGLRSGDEAKRLLQALESAHAELAQANRQVIESIAYARRIQASVLPDRAALAGSGLDVAVLWEPLHLVGGDYFWLEQIDGLAVIVVADCTGHGVPGAFLTLIVATALDRLLHERGLRSPAALLAGLDALVRAQLRQDGRGAESDDGLDCGICVYDPAARRLRFAGAGLSLTVIRDGVVTRERGARRGLGYPDGGREPPAGRGTAPAEDQVIAVAPGTSFYLMTDGITDQMGAPSPGARPRLIGHAGVAARLAARARRSLPEQLTGLEADLAAYRGDEARRDDMTLVAFRATQAAADPWPAQDAA